MTDDLARTSGFGLAAVLLAFELVVAVCSWYDARPPRRNGDDPTAPWLGRTPHGQLLLSRAGVIRRHIAERRNAIHALRQRYAGLGSRRHGRWLRAEIGRSRQVSWIEVGAACRSCRTARLKGEGHCLECGRRLVTPAIAAGT